MLLSNYRQPTINLSEFASRLTQRIALPLPHRSIHYVDFQRPD